MAFKVNKVSKFFASVFKYFCVDPSIVIVLSVTIMPHCRLCACDNSNLKHNNYTVHYLIITCMQYNQLHISHLPYQSDSIRASRDNT